MADGKDPPEETEWKLDPPIKMPPPPSKSRAERAAERKEMSERIERLKASHAELQEQAAESRALLKKRSDAVKEARTDLAHLKESAGKADAIAVQVLEAKITAEKDSQAKRKEESEANE